MIISRKYKYLFLEVPHTASTAISKELRELYGGEAILEKHALYRDFLEIASPEEKSYFVFWGVRHPMDDVLSPYFKMKTNRLERYQDPERRAHRGGEVTRRKMRRYRYTQRDDVTFQDFFLRFHRLPYTNKFHIPPPHKEVDYTIRYENLQEDFAEVLTRLGVEQQRPLPLRNKTAEKKADFLSYYDTPEVIARAKWVFAPFMEEWEYEFPPNWGDYEVSGLHRAVYRAVDVAKKEYQKHVVDSPLQRLF